PFARDVVAAHRLVTDEQVLEGAGTDVVQPGASVGRGGALVEDPPRPALAQLADSAEHVLGLPAFEGAVLEGHQVELGIHGPEGHGITVGQALFDDGNVEKLARAVWYAPAPFSRGSP